MKKITKITSIIMLIAMLMLSMAGCGGTAENGSTDAEASADAYHIGILQLLEHPALDKATEGFKAALIDKLGEDNVVFDEQNAQGEQANCATIANDFVSSGVDLILANATAALQSASAATADIPIVGTSITDYASALDIDDWTGTSGSNITGTSDLAPLDQQVEMISELVPDVTTVGILYCSAEANSVYQVKEVEKYLDEKGIAYKEYSAADSNEVQSVTTKAASECDCLYIPTDNTMANCTETINNVALPAGVPIICGEEGICKGCGVATLSIDYYDIGYAAGEMAYEILVNDADPGEMEIQTAESVVKEYNEENCTKLGITVPDGYSAIDMSEE